MNARLIPENILSGSVFFLRYTLNQSLNADGFSPTDQNSRPDLNMVKSGNIFVGTASP